MSPEIKTFLSKLKQEDFKGSETRLSIKKEAKIFILDWAKHFTEYETFEMNGEKLDIYNALLCLIYDNV